MFYFEPPAKPHDANIPVRHLRFTRSAMDGKWWHGGNPVATAFYNSLSTAFPPGEKFCVEITRHFSAGASPELLRAITSFAQQEMGHTREHLIFNRRVTDCGYDIGPLEKQLDTHFDKLRSQSKISCLAVAAAIEHLTAALAREVLSNDRHFRDCPPEEYEIWHWHCIEEVEHKSVVFDTWLHATKDMGRFRRWRIRSLAMIALTYTFIRNRTLGALELMRQDGITGPRAWLSFAWFALGNPGLFRRVSLETLRFFLPGFHPDHVDDRPMLDKQIKAAKQAEAARDSAVA